MKYCSDCGIANINESIWCRRCGSLFDDLGDNDSFNRQSVHFSHIIKKQGG